MLVFWRSRCSSVSCQSSNLHSRAHPQKCLPAHQWLQWRTPSNSELLMSRFRLTQETLHGSDLHNEQTRIFFYRPYQGEFSSQIEKWDKVGVGRNILSHWKLPWISHLPVPQLPCVLAYKIQLANQIWAEHVDAAQHKPVCSFWSS